MNQMPWGSDMCDYNPPRVNFNDEIEVMRRKENNTYKRKDYLLWRKLEDISISAESSTVSTNSLSDEFKEVTTDDDEIDSSCRITMCEWCYRVVDHVGARRELVEISMNYLDRFLDKVNCDRTAYKLVVITSMYLTIKLYTRKSLLTMKSLSVLSKGQFSAIDIAEMERIILQTLSWNLHPPTSANFIYHYHTLLPSIKDSVKHTLCQRSCFFAELAVMEYNPNWNPSQIAFSAILNALDGLDLSLMTKEARNVYIREIEEVSGVDHTSNTITSAREKIWILYSQSAQFELHDVEIDKHIGNIFKSNSVKDKQRLRDLSAVCVGEL